MLKTSTDIYYTGEQLAQAVELFCEKNDLTIEDAAKKMGIGRQRLYQMFKMSRLTPTAQKRAEVAGLTAYIKKVDAPGLPIENSAPVSIPFSITQLYTMWEHSEGERKKLAEALIDLVHTHNQVLKKKFNLAS